MAETLPPLLLPASCGAYRRADHAIEKQSPYGDAKMTTGAARRRRVYLATPRLVTVSLEVTLAAMSEFEEWFEKSLVGGTRYFSAQVANQGPGLLWWKARIVGTPGQPPYRADYLGGQWWQISMKLILFGEGSVTGPVLPALTGGTLFELTSTVTLTALQPISGGTTFEMLAVTSAAGGVLAGGTLLALLTGTYFPPASVGNAAGTSTAAAIPTAGFVGISQGGSTANAYQAGWGVGNAAGSSTAVAGAVISGLLYPDERGTWVASSGPLSAGVNDIPIYFKRARTIVGVSVLTLGGPGSCVIDVYKIAIGSYPPTAANSICAAAKPTISSGRTYVDTTLTGWTTAVAAGDTMLLHLDSTSTFTLIAIKLHFKET